MPKTMANLESLREPAARAVADVFRTMLEIDAEALSGPPPADADHPVVGAVYLAGGWSGAVLLECQAEQAFAWTSKLVSIPLPVSLNADVHDAVGELTSMVAGNFKSVLPPETTLSMPSVIEGPRFTYRLIGGHEKVKMDFDSPQGPFSLTVVQLTES